MPGDRMHRQTRRRTTRLSRDPRVALDQGLVMNTAPHAPVAPGSSGGQSGSILSAVKTIKPEVNVFLWLGVFQTSLNSYQFYRA